MKIESTTTVTLVLDEDERQWLHATMQNPLHGEVNPEAELISDYEMRKKFFDATRGN